MKKLLLYLLLFTSFNLTAQTNNYSLEFDGNNFNSNDGRVEFGNVVLGNNFTVCFWAKDSVYIPQFHELLNINGDFTIVLNEIGELKVNIGSSGNNSSWGLPAYLAANINNPNDWFHTAIVYDNQSLATYINGVFESSVVIPNYSINGYLLLGDRNFNSSVNYNHNGKLDDVSLWNIVMDSTQIQQYMQCPPIGSEPGLVGFWNFEEGTGTTAADQTSNENDGTLNGGVTWSFDVPAYNCNTSISELNNSLVKLFPNPSNDIINLTLAQHSNAQIILTDILGKEVLSKSFTSNEVQLNLKCLESKGTYFAKVLDIDGNVIAIKKLIYQ